MEDINRDTAGGGSSSGGGSGSSGRGLVILAAVA